jgi:hypothetical protein
MENTNETPLGEQLDENLTDVEDLNDVEPDDEDLDDEFEDEDEEDEDEDDIEYQGEI